MLGIVTLVVVSFLADLAQCATSCSRPQPPVFGKCSSSLKMMLGASNRIHLAVLQQLCEQGWRHVRAKQEGRGSTSQHAPIKRAEQFAVANLHRDSFSDEVSWTKGDAKDVVCALDWYVDDEVELINGYRWYRHGLPMWPLLNQTIGRKCRPFSCKKPDWPNYAFATPLYLVPHEIKNFRDPMIAIQKLFSSDLVPSQKENRPVDAFVKPDKFQTDVTQLVAVHGNEINEDPDDYKNWLLPLVKRSFRFMIESFKARQNNRGPKKTQMSKCPDTLYIFFLQDPCGSTSSCLLLNEVQLALRTASCSATTLIVGHSVPS